MERVMNEENEWDQAWKQTWSKGPEKKLYMCFVDLEKAFDRVPRKVLEWAMWKRGIPEAIVRAVMSL